MLLLNIGHEWTYNYHKYQNARKSVKIASKWPQNSNELTSCCRALCMLVQSKDLEMFRECRKIVPFLQKTGFYQVLVLSQLLSPSRHLNTETILENAAVLLQQSKRLHKILLQINFCNAFQDFRNIFETFSKHFFSIF